MAIIIPSKKIYQVKHNKFAENKVVGVSLGVQSFSKEEKVEEEIYNGTPPFYISKEEERSRLHIYSNEVQLSYGHTAHYTKLKLSYAKIQFKLNKKQGLRFIQKIKENEAFSYRLIGDKTEAPCSSDISFVGSESGITYENPTIQLSLDKNNTKMKPMLFWTLLKQKITK